MQETPEIMGSIPGLGSSPGGGHGNPLQYSCLENPMDRGAWRAIVQKSQTRLRDLHTHTHTHTHTQNSIVALLDFDRNSNTLSVQRNVHFSDNLWQLESCLLGIDVGFLS